MDREKKRWLPYITVVVFCLLIFGFTAATILTPSSEFSETENRVLAGMPEPRVDAILSKIDIFALPFQKQPLHRSFKCDPLIPQNKLIR